MAITLSQLTAFRAVARRGSVRAAAEELVVTQPSVSAALRALGKELGAELTERMGRGIRLSPAGQAYVPFAVDILGLVERGKQAAREAGQSSGRQLRLAAVTTAGEYVVPPLLRAFSVLHPEIDLTLEVGNRQRVFQRVLDHEADIAIGGRPPSDLPIVGDAFLSNEIVLITSPNDPLAGRRAPLERLADRTWLLREEGSGTRLLVEDFLAQHELRPATLTLGSNGAIKQAVRLGLGVSLQSRLAVELELLSEVLATITARRGDLPLRQWYALRPAVGPRRPAVQAFHTFLTNGEAEAAVEGSSNGSSGQRLLPARS